MVSVVPSRRSLLVQVKASLAQQYDAGFQPLLKEAEARHEQELQRVVELQKLVDEKGEPGGPGTLQW